MHANSCDDESYIFELYVTLVSLFSDMLWYTKQSAGLYLSKCVEILKFKHKGGTMNIMFQVFLCLCLNKGINVP